jgi:hypothetical protein
MLKMEVVRSSETLIRFNPENEGSIVPGKGSDTFLR